MKTLLALALVACLSAADRPKILGVAHLAVYVTDLTKSRQFYKDFLGFDELPTPGRTIVIKVNDHQYFELFPETDRGEGQLHHISFYTDNAQRMHRYLTKKNVAVEPVGRNSAGNAAFNLQDPDGHTIEIFEYRSVKTAGKLMPSTRISDHIMHVGVLVGDLDKSMDYHGRSQFIRHNVFHRCLSC